MSELASIATDGNSAEDLENALHAFTKTYPRIWRPHTREYYLAFLLPPIESALDEQKQAQRQRHWKKLAPKERVVIHDFMRLKQLVKELKQSVNAPDLPKFSKVVVWLDELRPLQEQSRHYPAQLRNVLSDCYQYVSSLWDATANANLKSAYRQLSADRAFYQRVRQADRNFGQRRLRRHWWGSYNKKNCDRIDLMAETIDGEEVAVIRQWLKRPWYHYKSWWQWRKRRQYRRLLVYYDLKSAAQLKLQSYFGIDLRPYYDELIMKKAHDDSHVSARLAETSSQINSDSQTLFDELLSQLYIDKYVYSSVSNRAIILPSPTKQQSWEVSFKSFRDGLKLIEKKYSNDVGNGQYEIERLQVWVKKTAKDYLDRWCDEYNKHTAKRQNLTQYYSDWNCKFNRTASSDSRGCKDQFLPLAKTILMHFKDKVVATDVRMKPLRKEYADAQWNLANSYLMRLDQATELNDDSHQKILMHLRGVYIQHAIDLQHCYELALKRLRQLQSTHEGTTPNNGDIEKLPRLVGTVVSQWGWQSEFYAFNWLLKNVLDKLYRSLFNAEAKLDFSKEVKLIENHYQSLCNRYNLLAQAAVLSSEQKRQQQEINERYMHWRTQIAGYELASSGLREVMRAGDTIIATFRTSDCQDRESISAQYRKALSELRNKKAAMLSELPNKPQAIEVQADSSKVQKFVIGYYERVYQHVANRLYKFYSSYHEDLEEISIDERELYHCRAKLAYLEIWVRILENWLSLFEIIPKHQQEDQIAWKNAVENSEEIKGCKKALKRVYRNVLQRYNVDHCQGTWKEEILNPLIQQANTERDDWKNLWNDSAAYNVNYYILKYIEYCKHCEQEKNVFKLFKKKFKSNQQDDWQQSKFNKSSLREILRNRIAELKKHIKAIETTIEINESSRNHIKAHLKAEFRVKKAEDKAKKERQARLAAEAELAEIKRVMQDRGITLVGGTDLARGGLFAGHMQQASARPEKLSESVRAAEEPPEQEESIESAQAAEELKEGPALGFL